MEDGQQTDPEFLTAARWLSQASSAPALIVLGVPFAGGSISRGRMDATPAAVRETLNKFSVWSGQLGRSVEVLDALDAGDIETEEPVEKSQTMIEEAVSALSGQSDAPLVAIGGDNSITVGLVRGVGADALLTFDAHHDCRNPESGATNGTPVRQLVEGGLSLVHQIGIHGFTNARAHAKWADDHGISWTFADEVRKNETVITMANALAGPLAKATRIWVDFDIDVLDRAFAPGAPAAMPGGLTPYDLNQAAFILGSDERVAGIDIVEVDALADVAGITVRVACSVLLSFACGVASR